MLALVSASHSFSLDIKLLCLLLCLCRDRFHGEISIVMLALVLAPVLATPVKNRLKSVRENCIAVKK